MLFFSRALDANRDVQSIRTEVEACMPLPMSQASDDDVKAKRPVAPLPEEWDRLASTWQKPPVAPEVDVLVPVYSGFDETMRCLFSVLATTQCTPYQLIVVDDCTPDKNLRVSINELADRGMIDLHRTPHNLGFVGACNHGMALHPERDIVLLNSDTEVFRDWLDRLRMTAYRRLRTGTVTPLSNNAEICSYPHFVQNNCAELGIGDDELDYLAARFNADAEVEIPTGVGFCMYVRRACLDDIGLFDMENFGRGYGEENDLCMRAVANGWRNVLSPDVFVRHYGATSFGASKSQRTQTAMQTMQRLHPEYPEVVSAFIRNDPVRPYREAIDIARLAHRAQRRAILFVTHSLGGGTERHVRDLSGMLEADGTPVFFCRSHSKDSRLVQIADPGTPETPNLPTFDIERDLERFASFLCQVGVAHVHVHHLAGFSEIAPDFIRATCSSANVSYDVTIHDYLAVCPRINLIDRSGIYCGEPDLATCEICIDRDGSPFGRPSVWAWRERYARLLNGARMVFVPDGDVVRRMRRFMPGVTYAIRPHPETLFADGKTPTRPHLRRGAESLGRRSRRVAILGAVGQHKGAALLLETARVAHRRGMLLEFIVVGYTDRDEELRAIPNLTITGRYDEGEILNRIAEVDADLGWFPAICPETYSYTLSAALLARLYPVAFDLGAIASRIRDVGWGELMPLEAILDPEWIAEKLVELPICRSPERIAQMLDGQTYPRPLCSYYELVERSETKKSYCEKAGAV